ncbi:MAG: hypothetical protein GEV04_02775 [Actinophytocola sp.]|nr:hypothetical protein [Actinophytocola sp.]
MTEEAAAQSQQKTVYLHIGTPKSGTTYLQGVLANNRKQLAARGVLWPSGHWANQVHAVRDLADIHPHNLKAADVAGKWQRLVNEIHAWEGHAAIVSMEWLVGAQPEHIQRAVDTLAPAEVQVIVTGRDLARIFPAGWQEAMQNWSSYTWDDYLVAMTEPESAEIEAGKRVWRQQDIGAILRQWGEVIPADRMHVVTVPPPGSDPGVLWQRFAAVIGIDPDEYDPAGRRDNSSLGVISAELMRRVNGRARERGLGWKSSEKLVKQTLAKRVLSKRSREEPSLALPADRYPWAIDQGKRIVAEVEQTGVHIWGNLEDLIPDPAHVREGTTPDTISDSELLDAALDGIVGMVGQINETLDTFRRQRSTLSAKLDKAEQALRDRRDASTGQLTRRYLADVADRVGWIGALRRRSRRRAGEPKAR